MRYLGIVPLCLAAMVSSSFGGEPSAERGLYLTVVGSCHDCHTEGYRERGGVIDPDKSLGGSGIGFQGPWGTSYPSNLRLTASDLSAEGFVAYLRGLEAYPPMPWYAVRNLSDEDKKSIYLYIRSLGAVGKPAPAFVPPGGPVRTPYIVLAPPLLPPSCSRDLDCGVGELCDPSGQCVQK